MLVKYKKVYEKIAMGLLSFMPEEKDIKILQQTIKQYETDTDWILYLWKEKEDFIGVVGISVHNQYVQLEHVCVSPSHRNQGVGREMVHSVTKLHPKLKLISNSYTQRYLEKCVFEYETSSTV